jgi:Flp pilus assembly pilin Flp
VDKYMYMALVLRTMLQTRMEELGDHLQDRSRGQGFVEYAFILLFVGVALTAALVLLKGGISGLFSNVTSCLGADGSAGC